MKRILVLILLAAVSVPAAEQFRKPKLVVAIILDQFRYDYLTRYKSEYKGGLDRLLTRGAVFTNAELRHFPTVTAVGHSVFLTGANPSVSGIIGNDWYDRNLGKSVTSVSDESVKIIGGQGEGGASPRRLLVSTVGDQLKAATAGKAKVIGVSLKDRAAILPSGHAADAAYWYDGDNGKFVSSTYYFPDVPGWVSDFNRDSMEKYKGAEWVGGKLPLDQKLFASIIPSPFGNDLLERFAERVVREEGLGKDEVTDLLTVSFSSNDYVGHLYGPDSETVKATCLYTDQVLDRFFQFLDSTVGAGNFLVVLAADHGVSPTPEASLARHELAGRLVINDIRGAIQSGLAKKYGEGKWVLGSSDQGAYLNQALIREKQLAPAEVENTVRDMAFGIPHIFRVYTRSQAMNGAVFGDRIGLRVMNGFNQTRSGDVFLLFEPFWLAGSSGTTHGTAFNYDAHVPVIFMGLGVRPGIYDESIAFNDIAPTLATMLEIEGPNGADGKALKEIIARVADKPRAK